MSSMVGLFSASGKKMIIDTDIGPDCDDAGALAVAFQLAESAGVEIAGLCNCTSNPYGSGAIDAIASYYGCRIPIGEYRGISTHLPNCTIYITVICLNKCQCNLPKERCAFCPIWNFITTSCPKLRTKASFCC